MGRSPFPALIPLLLLSACGGGGGGGGDGTAAGDPTAAPVIGSRAVPSGVVEVAQTAPAGFLLTTSVPAVSAVAVLSGNDYESARPVAVAPAGASAWSGTAAPGARLLVRLTLADGAVIETAPGDFILR